MVPERAQGMMMMMMIIIIGAFNYTQKMAQSSRIMISLIVKKINM
jgi:hypothetical protein